MGIATGLTSAITNPLHDSVMQAVLGADVMMGRDADCQRWLKRYRPAPAVVGEGARGRRGGGRRRRA